MTYRSKIIIFVLATNIIALSCGLLDARAGPSLVYSSHLCDCVDSRAGESAVVKADDSLTRVLGAAHEHPPVDFYWH